MPPRSDPPPQLTATELALLARLEGRPLPRGPALEAELGIGAGPTLRLLRRLQRQGWLKFGAVARAPPDACACISYVQADWSAASAVTLEDRFRDDSAILSADRILGASDYRLLSTHGDYRQASTWLRELREAPGVGRLTSKFCAAICDRPRFAAARLSADAAQARR